MGGKEVSCKLGLKAKAFGGGVWDVLNSPPTLYLGEWRRQPERKRLWKGICALSWDDYASISVGFSRFFLGGDLTEYGMLDLLRTRKTKARGQSRHQDANNYEPLQV